MKFKLKCWRAWGDNRSVGYNASGIDSIIDVTVESDNEDNLYNILIEKGILGNKYSERNRFRVESIEI